MFPQYLRQMLHVQHRNLQPFLRIHTTCMQCQKPKIGFRKKATDRTNIREMGYLLLIVPAATFCLGTWQVQRRKWKLRLLEELQEKTTAPPIDCPMDLDELRDLEYRRVRLRGHFDHTRELYVMPRSPVESRDTQGGGGLMSGRNSKSGAHVITAFQLADRDLRVVMNRGWVPRDKIKPSARQAGQVEEDMDVVGVVRLSEGRQQFAAANDPANNQWYHRDVEAMSQSLDASPIWLDITAESSVAGGPIGGQTRVTLRNEHFSYIVTWYSLAALTFGMWYVRYWK